MILTPAQSIFLKLEKILSPDELFIVQKEFMNSYAEGYFKGNGKKKEIKNALLNSNIYREIVSKNLMEWIISH